MKHTFHVQSQGAAQHFLSSEKPRFTWEIDTVCIKVVTYGMMLMYFTVLNQVSTVLKATKLCTCRIFAATPWKLEYMSRFTLFQSEGEIT